MNFQCNMVLEELLQERMVKKADFPLKEDKDVQDFQRKASDVKHQPRLRAHRFFSFLF